MRTGRFVLYKDNIDVEMRCCEQWMWGIESALPQSQHDTPQSGRGTIAQIFANTSVWLVSDPSAYHPILIKRYLT